jgi:rSAM/selenodomain-associated transferase 1
MMPFVATAAEVHAVRQRRSRCALAVMARAPSAPGKTRLAAHLTPSRLHALRSALLADACRVVRAVADVDHFVFFTPDDTRGEIEVRAGDAFQLVPQRGEELGERMRSAFAELLTIRQYEAAVLVGSDIPLLGVPQLTAARDALETLQGVVLGPADDGGYYLIGMTAVHDALFTNVRWGSELTLRDTLTAAQRGGLEARLLQGTYDIDTSADLQRLERDLAVAAADVAPHVRSWFDVG